MLKTSVVLNPTITRQAYYDIEFSRALIVRIG